MEFADAAAGIFFPLNILKNDESAFVNAPDPVNALATQGRPRDAVQVAEFDAVAAKREPA